MEFDSNLKFKDLREIFVKSDLELEPFVSKVWDIAASKVKHVGQAGETEIWLDCSDFFRTRHISILVTPSEGGYTLRFRGGSRQGMIADVLVVALAIAAFWLLGKIFVPDPPAICIAGLVACFAAMAVVLLYCGKAFGAEHADQMIDAIKDKI